MIAVYKGKQFRRSVGVQSQTTYLCERSQSRFQAKENASGRQARWTSASPTMCSGGQPLRRIG